MIRLFLISFLFLSLSACQSEKNHIPNTPILEQYLHPPFDTSYILSQVQLTDSLFYTELMYADKDSNLFSKIDTLELMYIAYACYCPYWVEPAAYKTARKNEQSFNQGKYSYYLEPATESLKVNWHQKISGNKIIFYGRHFKKEREASKSQDGFSQGKVFKYYGYKIIKPYNIWGPKIFDSTSFINEEGDSIWNTLILEIE